MAPSVLNSFRERKLSAVQTEGLKSSQQQSFHCTDNLKYMNISNWERFVLPTRVCRLGGWSTFKSHSLERSNYIN